MGFGKCLPRRAEGGREGSLGTNAIVKVACVALVATVMFPVGKMLFPYVAAEVGTITFGTLEAVVSATLGYSIYAALFG
jgi:hypothetical protein